MDVPYHYIWYTYIITPVILNTWLKGVLWYESNNTLQDMLLQENDPLWGGKWCGLFSYNTMDCCVLLLRCKHYC